MMAQGRPSAEELALLEPFRGRLPDEVFGPSSTVRAGSREISH
jgi:microcin C transport system substrate-binding protein